MTFVTFVVPTMGRQTLLRTIESLKNQTNPDWKAVIAGDCEQIGEEVTDPRITFLYGQYGNTAGQNRNRAIPYIDTPWVAFVDDDDCVAPDYVDTLIEEAQHGPCVVFKLLRPDLGIMPRHNAIEWGNVGIHYAIRTELFEQYPFVRQKHQDFIQLTQIENAGHHIHFSPHLVYYARTPAPERPNAQNSHQPSTI